MAATPRASERAYGTLRDEILRWELPPGTLLGEVEQASRLGVSRTPLREALARLVADGLVVQQGGRGLVVTDVSIANIPQLFEVRQALEEQAARLAAARADRSAFHGFAEEFSAFSPALAAPDPGRRAYYELVARFDDAIDDAVGNPYLASALSSLRTHVARARRLSQDNPARLAAAAGEHRLIAHAIATGDAQLAAHATHVHLHNALQSILSLAATRANHERESA